MKTRLEELSTLLDGFSECRGMPRHSRKFEGISTGCDVNWWLEGATGRPNGKRVAFARRGAVLACRQKQK